MFSSYIQSLILKSAIKAPLFHNLTHLQRDFYFEIQVELAEPVRRERSRWSAAVYQLLSWASGAHRLLYYLDISCSMDVGTIYWEREGGVLLWGSTVTWSKLTTIWSETRSTLDCLWRLTGSWPHPLLQREPCTIGPGSLLRVQSLVRSGHAVHAVNLLANV